jgi:hypothetical protein
MDRGGLQRGSTSGCKYKKLSIAESAATQSQHKSGLALLAARAAWTWLASSLPPPDLLVSLPTQPSFQNSIPPPPLERRFAAVPDAGRQRHDAALGGYYSPSAREVVLPPSERQQPRSPRCVQQQPISFAAIHKSLRGVIPAPCCVAASSAVTSFAHRLPWSSVASSACKVFEEMGVPVYI